MGDDPGGHTRAVYPEAASSSVVYPGRSSPTRLLPELEAASLYYTNGLVYHLTNAPIYIIDSHAHL